MAFPPVTLVVPFPPGGPSDLVSRAFVPAMERQLGKPVRVENRPGDGGETGTAGVVGSAPDGTA